MDTATAVFLPPIETSPKRRAVSGRKLANLKSESTGARNFPHVQGHPSRPRAKTAPGGSRQQPQRENSIVNLHNYLEKVKTRLEKKPEIPDGDNDVGSILMRVLLKEPPSGEPEQNLHDEEDEQESVLKEKESVSKQIQEILGIWGAKERELQEANAQVEELQSELTAIASQVQRAQKDFDEHMNKVESVRNLREHIELQESVRDDLLKENAKLEDILDDIEAGIATKSLVKQVIEKKLEMSSESKIEKIKTKNMLLEEVATEKHSHVAQIESLLRRRQQQREEFVNLQSKVRTIKSENVTLEGQLEKAKSQVKQLILQIGRYEAKAARELKAEKKAKELAIKSKYPTGTIAIAFSDVQCSTLQWEQYPEAMGQALEIHNSVLRENLKITGGYEVKTEGDSFMVSFASPVSALWWCLFVQEALIHADWPAGILKSQYACEERDAEGNLIYKGLRIRMGIHMGKPECKLDPVTGRMDYFGGMVNRAARISGIACGGQILMSSCVWEAAKLEVNQNDLVVEFLGEHFLKGLKTSEQLYQVLPKRLAGRKFPVLVTTKEEPLQSQEGTPKFKEYEKSEEAAEEAVTGSYDTEKLTSIVHEIDETLKERNAKEQSKAITKELKQMKLSIKQLEEQLAETIAEKDLLTYQIEKCKKTNALFQQDIIQAKSDKDVGLELVEGFEGENLDSEATLRANQDIELYSHQLRQLQMLAESEYTQVQERINLAEHQLKQLKQESDYYMRQIQQLDKTIREKAKKEEALARAASTRSADEIKIEQQPATILRPTGMAEINTKAQQLEEEYARESLERDTIKTKVQLLQMSINQLEDELRPVLMKKVKILEEELLIVKEEKESLRKQIDEFDRQFSDEKFQQTRLLNDASGKVQSLKQKNLFFIKRLARSWIQNGDNTLSLEDTEKEIQRYVEEQARSKAITSSELARAAESVKSRPVSAKVRPISAKRRPVSAFVHRTKKSLQSSASAVFSDEKFRETIQQIKESDV